MPKETVTLMVQGFPAIGTDPDYTMRETIRLLLDAAQEKPTPDQLSEALRFAVMIDNPKVAIMNIKFLLDSGADIHAKFGPKGAEYGLLDIVTSNTKQLNQEVVTFIQAEQAKRDPKSAPSRPSLD